MRQTLIPKAGNSDAVLISYYEVIRAIRNRDKLNMIEWMATRMMDYKLSTRNFCPVLRTHEQAGRVCSMELEIRLALA